MNMVCKILLLTLSISLIYSVTCYAKEQIKAVDVMLPKEFIASNGVHLPYRIYLPENYNHEKAYSLLLFFHGAGARADDNVKQLGFGIFNRIINGEEVIKNGVVVNTKDEFIVIAPQCDVKHQWVDTPWDTYPDASYCVAHTPKSQFMLAAEELLAYTESQYHINKKRIYISGVSMGGFGAWDILMRNPYKFAAAIPMAGGADITYADKLSHIPIWTFHQVLDKTVYVNSTESIVKAIVKAGGNIKYTPYFEDKHNAWARGFEEPELIKWLCSFENNDTGETLIPKKSVVDDASSWAKDELALAVAMNIIPAHLCNHYKKDITKEEVLSIFKQTFGTEVDDAWATDKSTVTREEFFVFLEKAVTKRYPDNAFHYETAEFLNLDKSFDYTGKNRDAMLELLNGPGGESEYFHSSSNVTKQEAILVMRRLYVHVMIVNA